MWIRRRRSSRARSCFLPAPSGTPQKAVSNADKHGVRFDVAVKVFADPDYLELEDHVRDGEVRTNVVGRARGITLFQTFTRRGTVIRLISARLAGRE